MALPGGWQQQPAAAGRGGRACGCHATAAATAAAAAQPMQTAMALICLLIILRFCHSQSADDAGEKQRRAAVGCGAGALVCEAWPVVHYC